MVNLPKPEKALHPTAKTLRILSSAELLRWAAYPVTSDLLRASR